VKTAAIILFALLASRTFAQSKAEWVARVQAEQEAAANEINTLLAGVDSIEVLSLDPRSLGTDQERRKEDSPECLSGWKVTGKATLTNVEQIALLRDVLLAGIRASDGDVAMCFNPRHALRFRAGEREVTIIICFECLSAEVSGDVKLRRFRVSDSPQPVFNQIFSSAGLPTPGSRALL
jgi:hypothetical protein